MDSRRMGRLASLIVTAIITSQVWIAHATTPAISAGNAHTLAVGSDGNVRSWGSDEYGQLGIGSPINISTPVPALGLSGVTAVSAGTGHSLALRNDGTVWASGDNTYGQLGDGTFTSRSTSAGVVGLSGVIAISAGADHSLALKSDGTVWGWGDNGGGQVGDGTYITRSSPMMVRGLSNVVGISAGGYFSMAVTSDGSVWTWGSNNFGQLGDGTTVFRSAPVKVIGLTGAIAVAAGGSYFAVALKGDGTVWTWGNNISGQLGDGTSASSLTPVQVVGLSGVVSIAAATSHAVAIVSGGDVWGWGDNCCGETGDGTGILRRAPVQGVGLNGFVAVAAGDNFSIGLKNDGTVWGWGYNISGQLGNGTFNRVLLTPVQTIALGRSVAISAGLSGALALESDGTVRGWGANGSGQLGTGTISLHTTPVPVPGLTNISGVAAGVWNSFAFTSNGSLWGWGSNVSGQIGDGTFVAESSPVPVSGLSSVIAVSSGNYHTVALTSDGSVWTWGANFAGQLGNGSPNSVIAYQLTPAKVATLSGITAIAAGYQHTIALRNDGTVWVWGANDSGQLGNGTTNMSLVPIQVSGLSSIKEVSAGQQFSVALKSDGTVWTWGDNSYGELGNGTLVSSLTPVQVGISNVVTVIAGQFQAFAQKQDGSIWGWGANWTGQLGDGTTIPNRLSPVQVTGFAGAVALSSGGNQTIALKSDGTVWAWGGNDLGQLGDGTLATRTSAVVVLNEHGAGAIQTNNWYLDLNPGISTTIPSSYIPPFLVLASGSVGTSGVSLTANIEFNAADVGKSGAIYVTAYVPPTTSNLTKSELTDNFLSMPADGVGGANIPIRKFSARQRTTSAPSCLNLSGQLNLTPSGWQPMVSGQLSAFVTGALSSQTAAQTFSYNSCNDLSGAQFCVGYSTSQNGTNLSGATRTVASVTASTTQNSVAGSCVITLSNFVPQSGYWYNPAEAGRGYTIEQNTASGNIFLATYLYSATGSPVWYAAGPAQMSGNTFSAPLVAFDNGQTLNGNWQAPGVGASPGNVSITFTDATDATLTWPGGTIPIQRFSFATNGLRSGPTTTQPQSGYWYNPAEGGRGYTIEVQADTVFIAAYMYDANGNPVWYASGPATLMSGNSFEGELIEFSGGQTLTGSFQAPTGTANAGNITLQFSSPTAGTLTLPDGKQISIERFAF